MSKLHVEVCKIDKIENLENADRMQMATVKGWQCLVGKDQHKEGELVIFVPPDAILPDKLIEDLKLGYLRGNNRIRTVKLRGYISQGLVLTISVLASYQMKGYLREGLDVAQVLGITKYEPPPPNTPYQKDTFFVLYGKFTRKEISLRRFVAKTFGLVKDYFRPRKKVNPNFDTYTDLDNIKHYPEVFEMGEDVIITEKIHGTNFRAGVLPLNETVIGRIKQFFTKETYEFVYGSHRVQKSAFSGKGFYGEDVYGQIAERYKLKDVLHPDMIIYGEIYGEKIQELTYGIKGIDVVFFDIKVKDKYLSYKEFQLFCETYNLPVAPVLFAGKFNQDTLKYATEGLTTLNQYCAPDGGVIRHHIREGCVVKPLVEGYSNRCGRKILKSISPEYLLTKKQDKPEEYVDDNAEFSH